MADNTTNDRDAALRDLLVAQVNATKTTPSARALSADGSSQQPTEPGRLRAGLVTCAVLVAVVAVSYVALNVPHQRTSEPATSVTPISNPTITPSPGQVLALMTSEDGLNQTSIVYPNGMSVLVTFTCTGQGNFSVKDPAGESAQTYLPGKIKTTDCGNGGLDGSAGHNGPFPITVSAAKGVDSWTAKVVAVKPTTFPVKPVENVTKDGANVAFCTAGDLSATYSRVKAPKEVTASTTGQITFTNTSGVTCALAGSPDVRLVDADQRVLGVASGKPTDGTSALKGFRPYVILAVGGHAYVKTSYYNSTYFETFYDRTQPLPAHPRVCNPITTSTLQVDLSNSLAGAAQSGTLLVQTPDLTSCNETPTTRQVFSDFFSAKRIADVR